MILAGGEALPEQSEHFYEGLKNAPRGWYAHECPGKKEAKIGSVRLLHFEKVELMKVYEGLISTYQPLK